MYKKPIIIQYRSHSQFKFNIIVDLDSWKIFTEVLDTLKTLGI